MAVFAPIICCICYFNLLPLPTVVRPSATAHRERLDISGDVSNNLPLMTRPSNTHDKQLVILTTDLPFCHVIGQPITPTSR